MWDLNDFYLNNVYEDFNFNPVDAIQFHDDIIEAIEERNAEKAKEIMEEHFKDYIVKLEDSLPSQMSN